MDLASFYDQFQIEEDESTEQIASVTVTNNPDIQIMGNNQLFIFQESLTKLEKEVRLIREVVFNNKDMVKIFNDMKTDVFKKVKVLNDQMQTFAAKPVEFENFVSLKFDDFQQKLVKVTEDACFAKLKDNYDRSIVDLSTEFAEFSAIIKEIQSSNLKSQVAIKDSITVQFDDLLSLIKDVRSSLNDVKVKDYFDQKLNIIQSVTENGLKENNNLLLGLSSVNDVQIAEFNVYRYQTNSYIERLSKSVEDINASIGTIGQCEEINDIKVMFQNFESKMLDIRSEIKAKFQAVGLKLDRMDKTILEQVVKLDEIMKFQTEQNEVIESMRGMQDARNQLYQEKEFFRSKYFHLLDKNNEQGRIINECSELENSKIQEQLKKISQSNKDIGLQMNAMSEYVENIPMVRINNQTVELKDMRGYSPFYFGLVAGICGFGLVLVVILGRLSLIYALFCKLSKNC